MDHPDTLGFKEFGHRYEIPIRRYEHRDVVIVNPGKTDHVNRHPDIDTLLLGSTHVGIAVGTFFYYRMADGTRRWRSLLLSLDDRYLHAGKSIHYRCCPLMMLPFFFTGRIVGTIEVEPSILTHRLGIDDRSRSLRQNRTQS